MVTFEDGTNEYVRVFDKGQEDLEAFEQIVIDELDSETEKTLLDDLAERTQ